MLFLAAWHEKRMLVPVYQHFLTPTSNIERPLEERLLEVVLRAHLEATVTIWVAREDIVDEAG